MFQTLYKEQITNRNMFSKNLCLELNSRLLIDFTVIIHTSVDPLYTILLPQHKQTDIKMAAIAKI